MVLKMIYDAKFFDEVFERRGHDATKWDNPLFVKDNKDIVPMWVADMDFECADCIKEALHKYVDDPLGYFATPQEYYETVIKWEKERHGFDVKKEWICITPGIVPALYWAVKTYVKPGEAVIINTPVYYPFKNAILAGGCKCIESQLVETGRTYTIDYEKFEKDIVENNVKLYILCNPHNPSGRVWTRAELERVADICLRHDVFVIADEIHCELTYGDIRYTPYGTLGERCRRRAAICVSPSKAFNIAGLQIANIVAEDDDVRRRIDRAINDNEVCDVNPFGVVATIAAYERGGEWLDALRAYLWDNYCFAREYIAANMPLCKVTPAEGTYLLWVDVSAYGIPSETLCDRLEAEARVKLSPGPDYGPGGEGFVRINLACPRSRLAEGLRRIAAWLAVL